jgi:hypothetical protein
MGMPITLPIKKLKYSSLEKEKVNNVFIFDKVNKSENENYKIFQSPNYFVIVDKRNNKIRVRWSQLGKETPKNVYDFEIQFDNESKKKLSDLELVYPATTTIDRENNESTSYLYLKFKDGEEIINVGGSTNKKFSNLKNPVLIGNMALEDEDNKLGTYKEKYKDKKFFVITLLENELNKDFNNSDKWLVSRIANGIEEFDYEVEHYKDISALLIFKYNYINSVDVKTFWPSNKKAVRMGNYIIITGVDLLDNIDEKINNEELEFKKLTTSPDADVDKTKIDSILEIDDNFYPELYQVFGKALFQEKCK